MLVTIVIGTRNRASTLGQCLAHLASVTTRLEWELIVVDNGSTDATAAVLAEFARTARFPVSILYEPVPGVGRAKNVGWRAAKGEFVGFIDDDCYVPPDYIDNVVGLFRTNKIGYGGGRVSLFDAADYPITIQLSDHIKIIPPYSFIQAGFILGANMAFRRIVLEQIGGFDPDFGPGNKYVSDDPDIQARASFDGWCGIYDPALTVKHHHGRDARAAQKLMRTYCLSTGAYYAKFLLRRNTRGTYVRNIARRTYWVTRSRAEPPAYRFWEIQGAVGYLVSRARGWLSRFGP